MCDVDECRRGMQVYHISAAKKLPEWLTPKAKKRALRRDVDLE